MSRCNWVPVGVSSRSSRPQGLPRDRVTGGNVTCVGTFCTPRSPGLCALPPLLCPPLDLGDSHVSDLDTTLGQRLVISGPILPPMPRGRVNFFLPSNIGGFINLVPQSRAHSHLRTHGNTLATMAPQISWDSSTKICTPSPCPHTRVFFPFGIFGLVSALSLLLLLFVFLFFARLVAFAFRGNRIVISFHKLTCTTCSVLVLLQVDMMEL
jgi:hypothetical protein